MKKVLTESHAEYHTYRAERLKSSGIPYRLCFNCDEPLMHSEQYVGADGKRRCHDCHKESIFDDDYKTNTNRDEVTA